MVDLVDQEDLEDPVSESYPNVYYYSLMITPYCVGGGWGRGGWGGPGWGGPGWGGWGPGWGGWGPGWWGPGYWWGGPGYYGPGYGYGYGYGYPQTSPATVIIQQPVPMGAASNEAAYILDQDGRMSQVMVQPEPARVIIYRKLELDLS